MSLILTPELEKRIAEKVDSGAYPSAAEVVEQALDALGQKEEYAVKRAALLAEIDEGIRAANEGRYSTKTLEEILDDALQPKSLT